MPPRSLIRCLQLLVVLVCAAASAPGASDPSRLTPQGYVSDFAHILDATSRDQLERYCAALEKSTKAQLAIVTIPSLGETPIEDFANSLFRRWGIGQKAGDEGVLLLLAIRDRKSRIEVGYGLEPILPDGFVGSVLREMRPSLREGNYGQALIAGAAQIGDHIAAAKGTEIDRTLPRRAPPEQSDGGFPFGFVIIILVILFLMAGRGRGGGGFLTGMLLGNLLGGSRDRGNGWGRGGFGGYDGGGFGGFGGFGGGDSGGGGASGGW